MIHFDKSVQLEWHYSETHYGKGPMDGVGGTIKRVVFGLEKSNKITINTSDKLAMEASKAVRSMKSIYFSQDDEIIERHRLSKSLYTLREGTLDTHYVKHFFNSNGVCFLFMFNISPLIVLVRGCTDSESNENKCDFCMELYHEDETWLQCPSCKVWFYEECFVK